MIRRKLRSLVGSASSSMKSIASGRCRSARLAKPQVRQVNLPHSFRRSPIRPPSNTDQGDLPCARSLRLSPHSRRASSRRMAPRTEQDAVGLSRVGPAVTQRATAWSTRCRPGLEAVHHCHYEHSLRGSARPRRIRAGAPYVRRLWRCSELAVNEQLESFSRLPRNSAGRRSTVAGRSEIRQRANGHGNHWRISMQFQRDFGNDTERSVGADEQPRQVLAGRRFARSGSSLADRAVRHDHGERQDVVLHRAITYRRCP